MNKLRKLASLFAVLLVSISMTASFAIPSYTVMADETENVAENDDVTYAENPDNFSSPVEQNKYKIWSILRGMGMTEYEAAGVMGCWQAECNFCPEAVEGHPVVTNSDGELSVSAGSGIEDFDDVSDYIMTISSQYTTYHDIMTTWVLTDVWCCWGGDEEKNIYGIQQARQGNEVDNESADCNPVGYFVDGQGWCGIGLAQWTADRAVRLISWSSKNNCSWWVLESQIAFMLTEDGDSAERFDYVIHTYMPNFKDSTDLTAITTDFANWFEGCWESNKIETRVGYAEDLYAQFAGTLPDLDYAYKVLAETDVPLPAYITTDIVDRAIFYHYMGRNLIYPQNSGFIFTTNSDFVENENGVYVYDDDSIQATQYDKNVDVYTGYVSELLGEGNTSDEYCLFELFGENLHWYRYVGESTYSPTLPDHIWSGWYEKRLDKLEVPTSIFYSGNNYLSANVYEGRPRVLSIWEVFPFGGYTDPRTSRTGFTILTGYLYNNGELAMAISKFIVATISLLIGDEIPTFFVGFVTEVETSDAWEPVVTAAMIVCGFGIVFLIFSLVKKVIQYAQGKGSSPVDIVGRFLIGILALGMLMLSLAQPTMLNGIMYQTVTVVDQIFNSALCQVCEGDEIISCNDESMQVHAYLWRTAVFGPWCRGQFGYDYDELYTTYATLEEGQSAMPQSHDEVDLEDYSGNPFYNSAKYTGDVVVPIGGGRVIRNWAAFLMSCGSPYHIDYTVKDAAEASEIDLTQPVYFPNAHTTAYDATLMADTYRVIDAQFNIAPQEYADGMVAYNYTNSQAPNYHFYREGAVMLFNSLMLLMMVPSIWGKLKNFFMLILTIIQLIWFSIAEIFKESAGFKPFWEKLKKHLIDYVLFSLKIVIMITLYGTLVDKGFILAVVYIVCCLTLQSFKWQEVKRNIGDAKYKVHQAKEWAKRELSHKDN